jgi:hypothetical protein
MGIKPQLHGIRRDAYTPLPSGLPGKTVITINFIHLKSAVHKIQELTHFVNKMGVPPCTDSGDKSPMITVVVYMLGQSRDIRIVSDERENKPRHTLLRSCCRLKYPGSYPFTDLAKCARFTIC